MTSNFKEIWPVMHFSVDVRCNLRSNVENVANNDKKVLLQPIFLMFLGHSLMLFDLRLQLNSIIWLESLIKLHNPGKFY